MRKVFVDLKVKIVVNMDDDVEVSDVIDNIQVKAQYKDSSYDIEDYEITDYEITDSK